MKRIVSLFLIFTLLAGLCGCSEEREPLEKQVEFFYQRTSYGYGVSDGVISSEFREVTNRPTTMLYLLSLYLQGPVDPNLRAPFPEDCTVESITRDGKTLIVKLSPSFSKLKNANLTVACACIAKTCFSLSDATQVQILADASKRTESVDVLISIDSLLLEDNSGLTRSFTEESQ